MRMNGIECMRVWVDEWVFRWLPPCTVCFADAQRFCVDCSLTFCHDHFDTYHDDDEKRDHEWRGADTDKVRRSCMRPVYRGYGTRKHICVRAHPFLPSTKDVVVRTGQPASGRGVLHRVSTQGRQARVQDLQGPVLRTVSSRPSSSPQTWLTALLP